MSDDSTALLPLMGERMRRIRQVPVECVIHPTLGGAILGARSLFERSGQPHTVAICGGPGNMDFCTLPSAVYAHLREQNRHEGVTPLVTFRRGGLDVHRDSFSPVAAALLNHERF